MESAMRTGADLEDQEIDFTASNRRRMAPGSQINRTVLPSHHLSATSDSESRGRSVHRHSGRYQILSDPTQPFNGMAPHMAQYFRGSSSRSPVRSGRHGAGHHPYQSESRSQLASEPSLSHSSQSRYPSIGPEDEWRLSDQARVAQLYTEGFPASYARGAQSDSGIPSRFSLQDIPTRQHDAYLVGNARGARRHGPHGFTTSIYPTRPPGYSSTETSSSMNATSGSTMTHDPRAYMDTQRPEQYSAAHQTSLAHPSHLDPDRYEKMRVVTMYDHSTAPLNSQYQPGPSTVHHTHRTVEIPPYVESAPQGAAQGPAIPSSDLVPLQGEELGRPVGANAQKPAVALANFRRVVINEFIRGILENGPSGFLRNTNFGEGYHQAVIRSYNIGLRMYEAGPNRGVLNTATGDASFANMREGIPGLQIGKMHASICHMLEGSFGEFFPETRNPPEIERGSWEELRHKVESAKVLLGTAGENPFLHKVEGGIILAYQNDGFAAFITKFLFSTAESLGIQLPAAFVKLSPWVITYCAILMWYHCKSIADNKTRPEYFPASEWQERFDVVLLDVQTRFSYDAGLNQFALNLPARARLAYANKIKAAAIDKQALAVAKERARAQKKREKKFADAQKVTEAKAAVAAGKQRDHAMGSNSAPWTGSSLDGALGRSSFKQ